MHLVTRLLFKAKRLDELNIPLLPNLIYKFSRIVFSCDIHYSIDVGNKLGLFHNGLGVVIHRKVKIGTGVTIYQNVTIGGNGKSEKLNGAPVIGDNVVIGAGAVILGPIIIGNNVKIGANSVVVTDIRENCTAVGVPARIVNHD